MWWRKLIVAGAVALVGLVGPTSAVRAQGGDEGLADPRLALETVEPSRIRLGDYAVIRVTSLDGYLKSAPLPVVTGLTFEMLGRTQGMEFSSGRPIPATYILIKVTPHFLGVFTIPGLTPASHTLGLEVVKGDEPNPYALHGPNQFPTPLPVAPAPVPKGLQLKYGGAAFAQMIIPSRPIYVGESVPVEIEVGVRPGIVTSMNGLPTLKGDDFTLNNLSRQPKKHDQVIEGNPFTVMTWHSVLAAVKPGDFSLSVDTPISVKINTYSQEDIAIAAKMGWPFLQGMYNGIKPKDVTISSASSQLKVLPLPAQGRPKDFSGAVGDFKVSSEISPARVAVGDPATLRLHVSGAGNFDRVESTMLDHLDRWKTYPEKSSFTASDPVGYKGEKVFEQPLIAQQAGEQTIPGLDFSYFNPNTQRYEHARTEPVKVMVGSSLADSSLGGPGATGSASGAVLAAGLRPNHARARASVSELRPLYFQASFLAVPATLVLVLAGSWFAVRPDPLRAVARSAQRVIGQLEKVARGGDAAAFFEVARAALLRAFVARWRIGADQITVDELTARLGVAGDEVAKLWGLADEAKYSGFEAGGTDFEHWIGVVRGQLVPGRSVTAIDGEPRAAAAESNGSR